MTVAESRRERLAQVPQAEAAELLGVSARTLEDWRRVGGGPKFVKLSRNCVRYPLREIEAFQQSRLVANNSSC